MIDAQHLEELEQQWLPFELEEIQQKETKLAVNLPHFENPRNDNQKLLNLQYEYKNGRDQALDEMYRMSVQICLKFIHTIGKENHHVRKLPWEEKQIKAHDAATYIPLQYKRRPDFVITKNIPGYLYLRVLKELYHRREVDKIVDFVDLSEFFKEGTEDEIEQEE